MKSEVSVTEWLGRVRRQRRTQPAEEAVSVPPNAAKRKLEVLENYMFFNSFVDYAPFFVSVCQLLSLVFKKFNMWLEGRLSS